MSSKRYTDEYKAEAVNQVLGRGHAVTDVAKRLGINRYSLGCCRFHRHPVWV